MAHCPHCGDNTWTEGEGCDHGCHEVAELRAELRAKIRRIEALEAQVKAADAMAEAFEDFNAKIDKARAPVGAARITAIEALAAYRATKEGGA